MSQTVDSSVSSQSLSPGDLPSGPPAPPGRLAKALRVPLRRWKLSLACAVLSGVVAAAVGLLYSQKFYRAEGVLLYTPLPLPESLKNVYNPQKMESLISIIKSTRNLETLISEFELGLTPEVLSKKIVVAQVPRTETVSITLDWGDQDTGEAIVNRLMELHIQHVVSIQRDKTNTYIDNIEGLLKPREEELAAVQQDLAKFRAEKNIFDIKSDRDRLTKEVSTIEGKLLEAEREAEHWREQFEKEDRSLAQFEAQIQQGNLPRLVDVEADTAYQDQKRKIMDAIRTEENLLAVTQQEHKSEMREYQSLAKGVPVYVSRAEADKAYAKVEVLAVKMRGSEAALKKM